jgi:hypothetical protein
MTKRTYEMKSPIPTKHNKEKPFLEHEDNDKETTINTQVFEDM